MQPLKKTSEFARMLKTTERTEQRSAKNKTHGKTENKTKETAARREHPGAAAGAVYWRSSSLAVL